MAQWVLFTQATSCPSLQVTRVLPQAGSPGCPAEGVPGLSHHGRHTLASAYTARQRRLEANRLALCRSCASWPGSLGCPAIAV